MNESPLWFFILIVVVFWSGGCGLLPEEEQLPTLIPREEVPTIIAMTARALDASTPDDEPHNAESGPVPSSTPTVTPELEETQRPPATDVPDSPTPTITLLNITAQPTLPDRLRYGVIQFQKPGGNSRVISPLEVRGYLQPGEDGEVHLALYGEDGRLLVRKVLNLVSEENENVYLKDELAFEIAGAAETARLEISTYDRYGRVEALATRDLILLSSGEADINPPSDFHEDIIIQQPSPSALVQGGELIVSGITRHAPDRQLYVEIQDFEGKVLSSRVIGVSETELGEGYFPFAGEIPFDVGEFTMVRVLVYARDGKMSGVVHISSVVISLSP